MTSRKKFRDIIGYTLQKQQENANLWHELAVSFHEASIVLHKYQDQISGGIRIFQFNAAMSLELILKAILAAQGEMIPTTHNLRALCNKIELDVEEDLKLTLDLLSQSILWLGRYPAPKSKAQWDNFHDNIFEKHKVRSHSGNTHSVRANPKRFPSMENYAKIWEICFSKLRDSTPPI